MSESPTFSSHESIQTCALCFTRLCSELVDEGFICVGIANEDCHLKRPQSGILLCVTHASKGTVVEDLRLRPTPPAPASALDAGGSLAGSCPRTNARRQFVFESQILECSRAA